MSWGGVFLPKSVRPVHYELAIVPDFTKFEFQGHVAIDLEVVSETKEIVLHSAEITFPSDPSVIFVTSEASSEKLLCIGIDLDEKYQQTRFRFPTTLAKGNYQLSLNYHGIVNDALRGFYRSSYTGFDGNKRYMGITQFEATDARRALPCWDEPAFKATFGVTLIVSRTQTAVSNMPVIKSLTTTTDGVTPDSRGLIYGRGMVEHHYAKSPVMSTYLLAWVIGEMDYIGGRTRDGVEVRVYTPEGRTPLAQFALDVATRALEFYNEYFDFPYPLPKVDLLACPDFAAGAMENWGCITYRETKLLIDPQNSSLHAMQRTARTICHELAHMWFGNLVTMKWWTYLWLNEGFARFMEFTALEHLFPDWDIWTQFVHEVQGLAQSVDSLEHSHAIEIEVNDPDSINEIFDGISYAKGASVIRMLQQNIGTKAFQTGLRAYMKQHQYDNTTTEDLWQAWESASGVKVSELMNGWIKQSGFPVLQVEEDSKTGALSLTQQRFLANGKCCEKACRWAIPIAAQVYGATEAESQTHSLIFPAEKERETLPDWASQAIAQDQPLSLNANQAGFYRVHYPDSLVTKLSQAVLKGRLSKKERLGFLSDVFALARAGRVPMPQAVDILPAFVHESDYYVLSEMCSALGGLLSIHREQVFYPKLQALVRELLSDAWGRIGGWDTSANAVTQMMRASLVHTLGLAGQPDIVGKCRELLLAYAENEEKTHIAPDVRSPVYEIAAMNGGEAEWNALWHVYYRNDFAEERRRVLLTVGKIREPSLLAKTLQTAFDEQKVRIGDLPEIVHSLASHDAGRELTWSYVQEHWSSLSGRLGYLTNFVLGALLKSSSDEKFADAIQTFFAANPSSVAARTIQQAIELTLWRANRLKREAPALQAWFSAKP